MKYIEVRRQANGDRVGEGDENHVKTDFRTKS